MRVPFFLIDAFAHGPFTGNPAGVVILEAPLPDETMQAIGGEINQAETAFVWPEGSRYRLRWFTPTTEVDLCGHATLASAHALGKGVDFITRSGVLTARQSPNGWELDFPAEPFDESQDAIPGTAALWTGRNRMDILALLENEDAVVQYAPDFLAIQAMPARGLIVTAPAKNTEADYVCRFFAPQVGVPEDPVTGSAHCGLSPFWCAKLGKTELLGYQASARGGYVRTEMRGERVQLSGKAITVVEGTLCL
ncbi:MAG: PhzF family phenazine biosynthesis protein [Methanoregulaceae archaeon]|nr:PhzF family phenazine biosynthesis protein [Methanoregulaceae archaeon]